MVRMSESEYAVMAARLSRNSQSATERADEAQRIQETDAMLQEHEIQDEIVSFMRAKGIFPIRSRFGKRSTINAGTPDLICAHNGKPFAFEVKTQSGKCSDEQLRVHEQMRANGWTVLVVRSVEEVRDALRKVDTK